MEQHSKGDRKRAMRQVRRFRTFGLAAVVLASSLTVVAQGGDPGLIQQRLLTQIKLTTVTADRSDIVTPGSVVQLRRDGLLMYSSDSPIVPSNNYKNGKVSQGFLFKKVRFPGQPDDNLSPGGYATRTFVHGENVWVTGITVKDDGIEFGLYSDPYNNVRFYANLKVVFPNKREVPTVDAALAEVTEVLAVVPAQEQAQEQSQEQAREQPAPAQTQAPPPPSYQDVPPPPPPPAPAATLSIGMTRKQVLAAFGEPSRKAIVGPKEIFFYTDMKMKVTFTHGTVSAIE